MVGHALTYLLSFLLPLSPLLCGPCQRSNLPGSNSNRCCSRHCPEQSRESVPHQAQHENRRACPTHSQPPAIGCHSEPSNSLAPAGTPDCERRNETRREQEPRPASPCQPEHCRSAICGHSAIVLRPVNWTIEANGQWLSLDEPSFDARCGRDTVTSLQATDHKASCGRPANVGPTGRAARVAYASWLI